MAMLGWSVGAYAQQAAPADSKKTKDEASVEVIEVKGTRANLQSAQNIKRLADTIIDGISAEDIGVLADRSSSQLDRALLIEMWTASAYGDYRRTQGG